METKPRLITNKDAIQGMVRLEHHSNAPIRSNVVPTKHPSRSGGEDCSRKYYISAVKEAPEIAKHRASILNDKVVTSSDTHPRWDETELVQREAKNAPRRAANQVKASKGQKTASWQRLSSKDAPSGRKPGLRNKPTRLIAK
jgi:hypothetical protein